MRRTVRTSAGSRRRVAAASGINGLDEVTNMTHWWDASDEASITETAGEVDNLADKIGSAALSKGTATGPVTGNATYDQNGLNAVYCSANQYLTATYSANGTIYIVFALEMAVVNQIRDGLLSLSGTSPTLTIDANSTSQFDGIMRQPISATWTGGPYFGSPSIFELVVDASNNTIDSYVDNVSVHTQVTTYTTDLAASVLSLFFYVPWASATAGSFYECGMMLGNLPSSQDRTDIQNYLTTKWGL